MGQFRHAAVLVIFKRAHHFFNLQTQFSQAPDSYHKGGAKTRIDRAKRVDSYLSFAAKLGFVFLEWRKAESPEYSRRRQLRTLLRRRPGVGRPP